ncbi:unnamed protein product [Triticum turgidum subsp. durum]|uniref:Cytochrome oxidase subunit II transmembrane region profile domain-containing protein n=1 Tax=Triticum turgidum subsp. durum TaxID=4567 RepID=A0A9R0WIA6_TRITD|nr:unnamed protein product [Triticum turgidum subsp. durum]
MIILHHNIFFFLILILVFVSWMLVRALWHFNEQTNLIPQRIDLNVIFMTNAPNEGDFPIDQPPIGGLPDLQQEMAHAAHPEDIIAELTSKVERIFHEVGTSFIGG